MNKKEIVSAIAARTGMTKKDSEAVLRAFTSTIIDTMKKGDKIQLVGFGTFEVRKRQARKGRNPQNGAIIDVAAAKIPAFRAGKALKESALNK